MDSHLNSGTPQSGAQRGGALGGVKVLDLSRKQAGPYCTMLLADQGAEVLKVEDFSGDQSRGFTPYRADDAERNWGGYFASVNRNKRSIVVNLKTPEGKEVVRRLVRECDILVENFRPGVMERLGLSYEELSALNPSLVYAAIRGFGDHRTSDSPYIDWPAYDVVAQAMGGMMGITGTDSDHPVRIGPGVGDIIPGAFAVIGILSALLHARAPGQAKGLGATVIDGQMADIASLRIVQSVLDRADLYGL